MGKWKFTADEPRTYGNLSLEVAPGDVVDFDGDPPDGQWWEPVGAKSKTTEKE